MDVSAKTHLAHQRRLDEQRALSRPRHQGIVIVFRPNQHIENIALLGSWCGAQLLGSGAVHPGARRPVRSRRKGAWGRQWDADDLGEVGGERLLVGGAQFQKRAIEATAIEILADRKSTRLNS